MASAPSQERPPGSGGLESCCWGSLGSRPAPLQPLLPCPCPALPCYGLLHPPPLRGLFTQPVSAPYELPGGPPLLWPGPVFYSPLMRPGMAEDPSQAKGAASRESTAALKAWLGRHLKNPYPSKGEKVLLAIVSSMSLTQVSTWFANARRRLKKENRACWGAHLPKADGGEEGEEDSEGDAEGETAAPSTPRPGTKPPQDPRASSGAADSWLEAERGQGWPFSTAPGSAAGAEMHPPQPKIWCVAELATGHQPGRAAF